MKSSQHTPPTSAIVSKIKGALMQVPTVGDLHELVIRPRICGVYFLLLQDEIVYIGQSRDIVARINTHIDEQTKQFDRVLYLPCPAGLLDHYEKRLISLMRPRYNGVGPGKRMGAASLVAAELRSAVDGITLEELAEKAERMGLWAQTPSSLKRNLLQALRRSPHVVYSHADRRYRLVHPAVDVCGCQNRENLVAEPDSRSERASAVGDSGLQRHQYN